MLLFVNITYYDFNHLITAIFSKNIYENAICQRENLVIINKRDRNICNKTISFLVATGMVTGMVSIRDSINRRVELKIPLTRNM